ncbi:MAG: extracellular solute-binding protein [Anaerolineales bacterium]|nr:extracellular solute-binding protein [Anaerolineales bacterium]
MKNLYFSSSSTFPIRKVIQDFRTLSGNILTIYPGEWDSNWDLVTRIATYHTKMDVSEVGSTWIANLRSIGGIHSFSKPEIERLGGKSAFLPASWNSCISPADQQIWSIPWTVDTRFIFYRRNILEQAGIDATTAFDSDAAFKNTLQAIQDAGIANPLAIPTSRTRMVLHSAASWVWGAGGDFITSDGGVTLIDMPESMAGFYQYFELARFLNAETRQISGEQSDMCFTQGKAAVAISGPWLLRQAAGTLEESANIGVHTLPGVPFVGGSNLVIWNQSISIAASVELIGFLTSAQFQSAYFSDTGYLPSRMDVLSSPLYSHSLWYNALSDPLQKGRSFLPLRLWGKVEDSLCQAIHLTWDDIFNSTDTDYHAIVERNLKLIGRRLNMTLSSST